MTRSSRGTFSRPSRPEAQARCLPGTRAPVLAALALLLAAAAGGCGSERARGGGGGGGGGGGKVTVDGGRQPDGGDPDGGPGRDTGSGEDDAGTQPGRDTGSGEDDAGTQPGRDTGSGELDLGIRPDTGSEEDAGCIPDCRGRECGSNGCDGNCGTCEEEEVCSIDGVCTPVQPSCGNGSCQPDRQEDCATCPADCGLCCGNGSCDAAQGETCATCPADCSCPDGQVCRDNRCAPQPQNQAPRILRLSTSTDRITQGGEVTVSVVVTDPDGIDDLIGGVLESPEGASFGAFITSGQEGAYDRSVSWAQLHEVAAIGFDQGQTPARTFVAIFFDQAGHDVEQRFDVTLHCNGLGACDGVCTDLTTTSNCGGCGVVCAVRGAVCVHGACGCNPGFGVCSNECTDLRTTSNCGDCGNRCTRAGEVCQQGQCTCPAGQTRCGGSCVDTSTNPDHCGACNHDCPGPGATCANGRCACDGACARPRPGELVITELMVNPDAVTDAHGEWFEIVNVTDRPLSLQAVGFGTRDALVPPIVSPDQFLVADDVRVQPGEYFVLARDGNPATNGGVQADHAYDGVMQLNNELDDLTIVAGGQVIDRVAYWDDWPRSVGRSMQLGGQYDPATVDNANFTNWCASEPVYGDGDQGTPGEPNPACP